MRTDAHTEGAAALVGVVRAADAGLRASIADLKSNPAATVKAVADQALLLSKAAGALARQMPDAATPERPREVPVAVDIREVRKALGRLNLATRFGCCSTCSGVMLSHCAND